MSPLASPGRVLVTGGASGLGAAVVEAVAARGGHPIILDRVLPDTAHEAHVTDLRESAGTGAVVAALAAGGLDAVVTCAGTDACGPFGQVEAQDWERVVQVNLLGTAAVLRAALPALEAARGSIVTVASTLGVRALPDATAYCASKFGVVGFTRALSMELAGRVRVTCLIPGGMRTPFFDGRPERYRPAPDADLMDPADVAAAVLGLLADGGTAAPRELVLTSPQEPSWP